jgi:transposase
MSRTVLPDDLWRRLEPLLPKPRKNRHVRYAGRKPSDLRRIVTGILFVLRTGIPWRHLPATSDFPSGFTCLRYLRQWQRAGIWQRFFEILLAELQATHQIDWYRALVDSASVRAPCGGEKTGPNPTDRRKLGSKHHMLTDAHGIPLAVILTGANRHDVTQLLPLVDNIPHVKGKPVPRGFGQSTFRVIELMIPNRIGSRSKKGDKDFACQTPHCSWERLGQDPMVHRAELILAASVSKTQDPGGEVSLHP